MTTTQLIIVLLVLLVAVALVLLLVRRSSAKKDQARAEAAGIRAEAEQVATTIAGQQTFAAQAQERAEVARAEAERARAEAEQARIEAERVQEEAQRLEAEAAQQRAGVDETRHDYESLLTRADTVDPDVRTPEPLERTEVDADPAAAQHDALAPHDEGVRGDGETVRDDEYAGAVTGVLPADDDGERRPATRAEARQLREEAERAAWAGSPAAPVPGAAGAAVMGTSTWAEPAREDDAPVHEDDEARADDVVPAHEDAASRSWGEDERTTEDSYDEPDTAPAHESDTTPADESDAEPVHETASADESAGDARGAGGVGDRWSPGGAAWAASVPNDPVHPSSRDEELDDEDRSARIAAATDYRDEHADEDVWTGSAAGTDGGMTTTPAVPEQPSGAEHTDEDPMRAADDARTPSNEWGGPHADDVDETPDDEPTTTVSTDHPSAGTDVASTGIDSDTGASARAEASEADGPVEPAVAGPGVADAAGETGSGSTVRERGSDDTAAPTSAWSDEPVTEHRADEPTTSWDADPSDDATDTPAATTSWSDEPTTPSPVEPDDEADRDWGSAEGERLEENADRADRLAQEREQLEREAAAAGMDTPHGLDEDRAREELAAHDDGTGATSASVEQHEDVAVQQHDEPEQPAASTPRRVSDFHEIRDGGFGMGSAATIDDGAQPLDHPVQAYRDTMTFRVPGDPGYDEASPDVWFYDAGAAERSGFRRSEG